MPSIDPALRESVRDLHAHLDATGEYPVTERANRWLGEADAVAVDAVRVVERTAGTEMADTVDDTSVDDAALDALETRLEQVRGLLAEVEGTGSNDADEHVREARDLADELLADL